MHALVGQRRASHMAAQPFQRLAHGGVQSRFEQ
jgi:hypothetical protein